MSNYRKHVVETRLAKFYSTMNQAIQRAEVDYGDKKAWGEIGNGWEKDENGNDDTTKSIPLAWFNKYMKPYLKLTDVKTSSDGSVLAYFPDGSMAVIRTSAIIFYPRAKDYGESEYEKQLIANEPETSGKKSFAFVFWPNKSANKYSYGKGVEPFASQYWDETLNGLRDGTYGCREGNALRTQCTKIIQMNGWKVPKDYPLKF